MLPTACGSTASTTDPEPVASFPTTSQVPTRLDGKGTAPAESLTFRPVLTSNAQGPGPEGLPEPGDLGPSALDGTGVVRATAVRGQQGWTVNLLLADDDTGIGAFNRLAASCFERATSCPSGQAAIVLDGKVLTAPVVQTSAFEADQIQINAGSNEAEATFLADRISAAAYAK